MLAGHKKLVGISLWILCVLTFGYVLSRVITTYLPPQPAIVVYRLSLNIFPDDVPTRYALATSLLGVGQTEEAIAELRNVVERAPNVVRYRDALGSALLNYGSVDEAIKEFGESVRLDPYGPRHHYLMGLAFLKNRSLSEAIYEFKEVLRLDPKHVEAKKSLDVAMSLKSQSEGN